MNVPSRSLVLAAGSALVALACGAAQTVGPAEARLASVVAGCHTALEAAAGDGGAYDAIKRGCEESLRSLDPSPEGMGGAGAGGMGGVGGK